MAADKYRRFLYNTTITKEMLVGLRYTAYIYHRALYTDLVSMDTHTHTGETMTVVWLAAEECGEGQLLLLGNTPKLQQQP